MADFTLTGSNHYLVPGTYTIDDTVVFSGTRGRDTLSAGGGEGTAVFTATAGDDLYGLVDNPVAEYFPLTTVDYSGARTGIRADLFTGGGSRTFIDEHGDTRTIALFGWSTDGLGGKDSFASFPGDPTFSSIFVLYGSRFADHIDALWTEIHAGDGNDWVKSPYAWGDAGNDVLIGRQDFQWLNGGDGNDLLDGRTASYYALLSGDAGHDLILGGAGADKIEGGTGNDKIFAGGGNDSYLIAQEGDDFVDGGAGDDFIDGGVGGDVLLSGAGNDTINPDVEYFQLDPGQARDSARDVITVTKADLGDYVDVVLARSFEEDRDQILYASAVRGGLDFRVTHEDQSFNPDTGKLWRPDDSAGLTNTVLQIDQDDDGFGASAVPDAGDYYMVVLDADLSQRGGYLLT